MSETPYNKRNLAHDAAWRELKRRRELAWLLVQSALGGQKREAAWKAWRAVRREKPKTEETK